MIIFYNINTVRTIYVNITTINNNCNIIEFSGDMNLLYTSFNKKEDIIKKLVKQLSNLNYRRIDK